MYNQGNYQQFGQRLPPPPSSLQQGPQAYLNPLIPPPRIPPPNFYTIPPPSSYFTPASFGSLQPPPPSSPPPGPPPLPPSPPHDSSEPLFTDPELSPSSRNPFVAMNDDILNSTTVNGFEKSDIPPPKPTNETTVRMIEVLCQYIAKNGNEFEDMTCKKEVDNPEFAFLFGGPPGSEAAISHEYFKWMKKKCSSSELLNHSPASSDMDMEDDITQLYEHQTDFTSNKVDIKVEEYISHKDGNVLSRVPEGTNPITLIQDDNSENDDELHFENVSPVAGSPLIKESLNPSVVEPCLNTSSKIPELSTTTEKVKQVDEFGRLVKAGGISDSDSGDYKRRRGRSRSPSPNRKRRQSPRRRRSRSRSWSPKKRHRSRSPYRQRGEETRRNKSHYRGPTRHYIPESEKNDKNKHHYNQEVSDTKRDLVDPCEDANSVEQLVTESVTPPHIPNQISPPVPVSTNYPPSWNPLPPPPPLPQISVNYQNQSTLQLNYPFFKPYATELTPLQQPYYGISTHYNPYASTFDQPLTTNFTQDTGTSYNYTQTQSQYDPLFDSIEPVVNPEVTTKQKEAADVENDEFGETGDAEVENESPGVATGEVEKNKDSRSMKLFKVSLAEFVKEVLKPSWRQGNMSKEAFKTIVKKTVDKVSGAIKKHQVPKSQAKINHYIDSSQRKLTKLVMGYVDKYVKV